MTQDYWQRQNTEPLVSDYAWKKPERKSQAGRILIIGGNGLKFAKTQAIYAAAIEAGAGECKVVLPKPAERVIGHHPDIEFTQATDKGGFSLRSKEDLLSYAQWADDVIIPGELGNNSETTQLFEQIISSISAPIFIDKSVISLVKNSLPEIIDMNNLIVVGDIDLLQEVAKAVNWTTPIKHQSTMPELVDQLHSLTVRYQASFVISFEQNLVSATEGHVVSTRIEDDYSQVAESLLPQLALWSVWLGKKEDSLTVASWEIKARTSQ